MDRSARQGTVKVPNRPASAFVPRAGLRWTGRCSGWWRSFPGLQLFARLLQFGSEEFLIRQGGEVFTYEQLVEQRVRGVTHERFAFAGAQDDAHGRIFAGLHPVFAGVIQIQVHLPDIGMAEPAQLQIENNQAAQAAMEEEQVHAIPFVVNTQPALATDKGEVIAEFERIRASSRSVSEYSSRRPRNSRTSGWRISSSALTASPGRTFMPLASMAALLRERAVRS